jgi:hypothetical protein
MEMEVGLRSVGGTKKRKNIVEPVQWFSTRKGDHADAELLETGDDLPPFLHRYDLLSADVQPLVTMEAAIGATAGDR